MYDEDIEVQRDEMTQTQTRGTLEDEYDIYVQCARDLGWEIKTYQEWLYS